MNVPETHSMQIPSAKPISRLSQSLTLVCRMQKAETITVRVTPAMRKLLEQAVLMDTHLNESEFVREAIRQALERRGLMITAKRRGLQVS